MQKTKQDEQVVEKKQGASRRDFLKFAAAMTAALALPRQYTEIIAQAMALGPRIPVVWLEFQGCTGDSESFLRAAQRNDPIQSGVTDPGITQLVTEVLSVEYHETLMAASGVAAEKSLTDVMSKYDGQFVCIVEGSIPTALNGVTCTIAGQTALSRAKAILPRAKAVVAMGACSVDGGLAAAAPNPTGAVGVPTAVPGLANYLALPGCPANVVNLVASLVYLKTFDRLPDRDSMGRPFFAYGSEIHSICSRREYYDNGQFALAWGDEGHRKGWCLYRMGCRGPRTKSNCARVKWNGGTSWPVQSGHGCIGCTTPNFWDNMSPFYKSGGG